MQRILYAWSPGWAIANWKRRNPLPFPCSGMVARPVEAFALVRAEAGVRRLYAVDEGATTLGLFVGQKATDAAALAPELILADADPVADGAALQGLADWCARFSPAVALDPPDGLFLDITGVAHLWGGEGPMAEDLRRRLAANGLPVRVVVAASPGAAWALAHYEDPDVATRIIVTDPTESGNAVQETATIEEKSRLLLLPVAALRLSSLVTAQIVRLGLFTIGALAALPRDQIARRFGPMVLTRLDQALGLSREALSFRRPPNPWFARLAFAEPISTPEDLARAAADIATRLCARLEAEGQGARWFELAYHRLDGMVSRLVVGLGLAGREARALVRLFAPKLETVDPGFGIEVVTLAAEAVEPLGFRQRRLDDDKDGVMEDGVAPLVDRLANRLGEDAVWRAEPYPSHDPERAVRRRPPIFSASLASLPGSGGWDPERPRPLRLLRAPELIEAMAPVPDDPPVFFRWRGVAHRIRRAEGPERLAEEWWRRPFDQADRPRDYYRVEDEAGGRFWVYRDGLYEAGETPRWWLHGLFG